MSKFGFFAFSNYDSEEEERNADDILSNEERSVSTDSSEFCSWVFMWILSDVFCVSIVSLHLLQVVKLKALYLKKEVLLQQDRILMVKHADVNMVLFG